MFFFHQFRSNSLDSRSSILPLRFEDLQIRMSDIGYRTKVYSDIRFNVGLCALQSDIGRSYIRLSPISLITDIRLSAHLCLEPPILEPTNPRIPLPRMTNPRTDQFVLFQRRGILSFTIIL